MSLLEEIEAERVPNRRTLDYLLTRLSAEDRADLVGILTDPVKYPHAMIARFLRAKGYEMGLAGVRAYRERHGIS